jgi:DNA-binding NarL/FixJ family response regulator
MGLSVVIADDAALLREGLRRLLTEAGFRVAGTACDADTLLALVDEVRPDAAIVDIRMPPTYRDEGLRAAQRIRADHPRTGVLVLSQYVRVTYALELCHLAPSGGSAYRLAPSGGSAHRLAPSGGSAHRRNAQGVGYLLKDRVADVTELASALRQVAAGRCVLDPDVVAALVGGASRASPS